MLARHSGGASTAVRGFTMIEILVTLVIMMFGLLGIAGLILKGQKAGSEAYERNQALLIAMDMAEKMKTNRLTTGQLNSAPYLAGAYGSLGTPAGAAPAGPGSVVVPDCGQIVSTNTCPSTGTNLVAYDLATWNNLLVGTQESSTQTGGNVGGIVNALGCIEQPVAGGPVRISVAWQGNMATVVPTTSACGQGQYGASDSYRRVVSIDIL